jgi:FG-GAP-like repeat
MGMRKLTVGLSVSLILAGCGGGGGSSNDSTSNKPQSSNSPVVTISTSSTDVFQGDKVTVTWSATNATSCSASGAWSGSLATNGNQTIDANTAGSNTYTLTCSKDTLSTTASVILNVKSYFTEMTDSITVVRPYNPTVASNTIPADINGDGKDDIVVHMWSMENFGKSVGNIPTKSMIKIMIYDSGKFVDQTDKYLPGLQSLEGVSRQVKRADINGDGKSDLVYAVNQEDGRKQANAYDMVAQLTALVSNGSTYSVVKFGKPSWYHSVGIGYDTNHKIFVHGAGMTSNDNAPYHFTSSNNTLLGSSNVKVSPTTFEFYNSFDKPQWTNYLLEANNKGIDYTTVNGYIQNSNGNWTEATPYSLAPRVGSVYAVNYTGEMSPDPWPVFKIADKHITVAGMPESCQLKLSPNGENIVVFRLSGAVIPNFTNLMTVEQNKLTESYGELRGVKIVNNKVEEVPLNIKNPQSNKPGLTFDCRDVNNDGYEDMIHPAFSETGLPIIYLNNKNNGFEYLDLSKYVPAKNTGWGAASAMYHDFDKDGIADLLLYPGNSYTSLEGKDKWIFYKGNKNISLQ